MPPTKYLAWILAAVVASIAAMLTGITSGLPRFSGIAAGLFALALVATSIEMNRPWWRRDGLQESLAFPPEGDADAAAAVALHNARLLVIGYLWGALALLVMYRLTPLRWQHGLQYSAGMALIAWLAQLYAHFLVQPGSRLRSARALMQATWLSLAHGGLAFGGILFLVVSGKVYSTKDDWAANQIFLAGGLAVVALSLVAAFTQLKLARPESTSKSPAAGARN